MIRENQVGAIADMQAALYLDASLGERFDFSHERARIDNHAGADHRVSLRPQNPARNELQDILVLADDHGVTGVVPSGYACDVVERAGEVVDDLAFAFVTPLRAYDHHRFHSDALLDRTCPLTLHGG